MISQLSGQTANEAFDRRSVTDRSDLEGMTASVKMETAERDFVESRSAGLIERMLGQQCSRHRTIRGSPKGHPHQLVS